MTTRELKMSTVFEPLSIFVKKPRVTVKAEKPKLVVKDSGTPNEEEKIRKSGRGGGNCCVKCFNTSSL